MSVSSLAVHSEAPEVCENSLKHRLATELLNCCITRDIVGWPSVLDLLLAESKE